MNNLIGLDAGSVAIKLVVLDSDWNILYKKYIRHNGHPLTVAYEALKGISGSDEYAGLPLSITGSTGKLLADILQIKHINELVAQSQSVRHFLPEVKTIFEMGGEDSKFIVLNDTGIEDFSMNSVCAAGTGSFLEQQAERLNLTIEEFSSIATKSNNPPHIAGRCSVFAKSDMIHLQQIATPVEDIVAGLCFAVARNFKGAIVKGRSIVPKVSFQGGVAANAGIIKAFREIFDLDLVVPENFAFMGAIGAVFKDQIDNISNGFDLKQLESYLDSHRTSGNGRSPLIVDGDHFQDRHLNRPLDSVINLGASGNGKRIKSYLGIDIGSISTNLALINEEGNLISKRYLMTAGRPIDAVMKGLKEIGTEVGEHVDIRGVGTTGSGRYMIADLINADVVKNEITAQAHAAVFIDRDVDTIFEIGGQDSKYISIDNGSVVDFEMNKACAAGTGSFLEEQAEKLDVSIKHEFASCAFTSDHPCNLGERCTVFMENSMMSNLQQGMKKDDLLAGLAYSIVENYINRVVSGKKIGEKIFFQGGTAFNKSVVAAFEKYTGQEIIVPPNHDVTGAIGMALIARDTVLAKQNGYKTSFAGFEFAEQTYSISSFECKGCSNVCEINKVSTEGDDKKLFYGGRCEKYDIKKNRSTHEDLFAFREEMLWKEHKLRSERPDKGNKKIGIPYIFFFHDYLPFWTALLDELGFDVVTSPKTNREIISLGTEAILAETCFPVKVAHGHIRYLMNNDIEHIFLPSFVSFNEHDQYFDKESPCPYTQAIPYLAQAAFGGTNIISPSIDFRRGEKALNRELSSSLKEFRISNRSLKSAVEKARIAQKEFINAIKEKGKQALSSVNEQTIVVVGRAYNSYDSSMNMQLPQKLAGLNIPSIPMDFLPLESVDIIKKWPQMYWKSGKKILQGASLIKDNPMLFPVYISNFNCGPDSFIIEYFKKEIGNKPYLFLEIDEHSADAGLVTRCEAFLDSIGNERKKEKVSRKVGINRSDSSVSTKNKIFIPKMSDHAFALAAAFEHYGIHAEVLPRPTRETVEIGRKNVSGKQCYPCVVTIGEMLKKVFESRNDTDNLSFFMPGGTGPCRFGQYNIFQRLVLERLGHDNVKVISPVQDRTFYEELGIAGDGFSRRAWDGIVSIEMLVKCLHETRPYEVEKGVTDRVYEKNLMKLYEFLKGDTDGLEDLLYEIKNEFSSIEKVDEKRPVVGIIGEIFVRLNSFSNEDLIEKIEALGGEAWLAPVEEWIYYVNHIGKKHAINNKDYTEALKLFIKNRVQNKSEHRLGGIFKDYLRRAPEPSTEEIIKKAKPYINESLEGEAILSIGKSIDLIEKGVSGIVSVMPFGCMPGTIVTAIMRAISSDYSVPCISIPYDGTESVTNEIQLETFMHQVKSNNRN